MERAVASLAALAGIVQTIDDFRVFVASRPELPEVSLIQSRDRLGETSTCEHPQVAVTICHLRKSLDSQRELRRVVETVVYAGLTD